MPDPRVPAPAPTGPTHFSDPDLEQVEIVEEFDEPVETQTTSHFKQIPSGMVSEEEIVTFLDEEIGVALSERGDLEDKIEKLLEAYEAPPKPPKSFPFPGAANVTVPLVKEMVDTQTAALSQTILIPGPPVILQPESEEWRPFKNLLEQFLERSGQVELQYDDKMELFIREGVILGTAVVTMGHEIKERCVYIYNADGTQAKKVVRTVKNGPRLENVALEDFIIRLHEKVVQDAKWCAMRYRLNATQLKERVKSGKFRPGAVETILNPKPEGDDSDISPVTDLREKLAGVEPVRRETYTLYECWVSWDLGDGVETEIVVDFHRETRQVLSARFNPYRWGTKPFFYWNFKQRPHQFYGEGLVEMLQQLQNIISQINNQRLDNATLANTRMISAKKGSTSLKPGQALHMNKIVYRDRPDDVLEFRLGEVYPSTVTTEQLVRQYAERVAGMSDVNSRGGMPVTRTTFGAQSLLLQEAQRRLDNAIRNLRQVTTQIGQMHLDLYFQFGAGTKPETWMGRRGLILHGIFRLPLEATEKGIGLEASAPTSQLNRDTQRQNSLALYNLMTQMYTQISQMVSGVLQMAAQGLPGVEVLVGLLAAMVRSAKHFMFDVLEQFENPNPEAILFGLTYLEQVLPQMDDMGGADRFAQEEEQLRLLDRLDELKALMSRTLAQGEFEGIGRADLRGESRPSPALPGSGVPGPSPYGPLPIGPGGGGFGPY